MAQVAQMTKKDVGYMLATVSLNQPLHPEVRPYMLLKSMELNQESTYTHQSL
ncbi:hypothetical protein [Vibrio parahaemolyticus]|uniref:hypothetical protein n=1 Tax=Vibrio parahaemolyticus TaxID=670 RepID=UPI000AA91B82|nr:hypothetical protein [Vibrio parahaemolyticus]EGQ8047480.1 hypothetical protein [Vibrio parahaemolyticus]EHH1106159.1 hypothetical protein [Vibrio parahaemolyticus]EHH1935196.1 hypothetical protein [Vibrio parahaemolyticus]EHH2867565.1 hypothetical protein [Vibrio parahaemolyticus]EHK4782413.1 hypothetical protein [Vibrio parahaemolyticus]